MIQNKPAVKKGWFTKAPFHNHNKHLEFDDLKAIANGNTEALDTILSILNDFGIGQSKTVRLTVKEQDEFTSMKEDVNLYDMEMVHEAIEKDLMFEDMINDKSTIEKIIGSEMVEKMMNGGEPNISMYPSLDHCSYLTFCNDSFSNVFF